jgi:hypothetical protein
MQTLLAPEIRNYERSEASEASEASAEKLTGSPASDLSAAPAPTATKAQPHSQRRAVVFVVAAGIVVVVLLAISAQSALWPWVQPSGATPDFHPVIHRWHGAQLAALSGILLGGSLLALLWHPRRNPLLLLYLALGTVIIVAVLAPFAGPVTFLALIPVGLLVAAYPAPRALLHAPREGHASPPLVVLSLLAATILAQVTWQALVWQITAPLTEHARHFHWLGAVALALLLVLAGLLAATKRPGWEPLGILTGVTYLYLGLAAVAVPDLPGSWGIAGGSLALLAGAAYVAATLYEAHLAAQRRSGSAAEIRSTAA